MRGGSHTYLLYVLSHACPLALDEKARTLTMTVEHARPTHGCSLQSCDSQLTFGGTALMHDVGILCLLSCRDITTERFHRQEKRESFESGVRMCQKPKPFSKKTRGMLRKRRKLQRSNIKKEQTSRKKTG